MRPPLTAISTLITALVLGGALADAAPARTRDPSPRAAATAPATPASAPPYSEAHGGPDGPALVPLLSPVEGWLPAVLPPARPRSASSKSDVLVRIYDDPVLGAPVYEELHCGADLVADAGVRWLSLVMGSVDPTLNPLDVAFVTPLHVGFTECDTGAACEFPGAADPSLCSGAEVTPRTPLLTAPYAYTSRRANDAAFLDGHSRDELGDIMAVHPGDGLVGGGTEGEVTLSLDPPHFDGSAFDARFIQTAATTPQTMTTPLTIDLGAGRIGLGTGSVEFCGAEAVLEFQADPTCAAAPEVTLALDASGDLDVTGGELKVAGNPVLTVPGAETYNGGADAVAIVQQGTGHAASFAISNPASIGNALSLFSDGDAYALASRHGGTDPSAGQVAGFFEVVQASNPSPAVLAMTKGSGAALNATATGSGHGVVASSGSGVGVRGSSSSANGVHGKSQTGTGVYGEVAAGSGTQYAVRGHAAGSSDYAAYFTGGRGYFDGNVGIGTIDYGSRLFVRKDDGNALRAQNDTPSFPTALFKNLSGTALSVFGGPGAKAMFVNGDAVVTGDLQVKVLEIMGADLAERFPVSDDSDVVPGTVMAIDPDHPGQLRVARGAYDRRVAGVVSGANGLPAGAVLGRLPGLETATPIALSGRVWVRADATDRAIEPGDLLTTAALEGHAMVASDRERAPGATIGKAMTALEQGTTGMVLTLVNLQ